MELTEHEKQVLAAVATDLRRSDRRLYLALAQGRFPRVRTTELLLGLAGVGVAVIVVGSLARWPLATVTGWLLMILVALANASRPPGD